MHTDRDRDRDRDKDRDRDRDRDREARDKGIGTDTLVGVSVNIRWLQNSLAYSAVIIGGFNVSESALVQKMPRDDVLLRNRLFLRRLTYVQGYCT